jgi:hypothetical protein
MKEMLEVKKQQISSFKVIEFVFFSSSVSFLFVQTAQQETEKVQQLFDELKNEYDDLYQQSISDGPQPYFSHSTRNRLLPPLTPPAGKKRNQNKFHAVNPSPPKQQNQNQHKFFPAEEQQQEQEDYEGDNDLLDELEESNVIETMKNHLSSNIDPELIQEEEEEERRSGIPSKDGSSTKKPSSSSSRSTSPKPNNRSRSRSPSPRSSKHPVEGEEEIDPSSYIILDIDLENNEKDQLLVTIDSDPMVRILFISSCPILFHCFVLFFCFSSLVIGLRVYGKECSF